MPDKSKRSSGRAPLDLTDNQRGFLALVLRKPGAKRNDVATELGFSQQTAMRVVTPLVDAGIVVEIDEVTGARGKPPRLVHLAKSALLTIAFVIGPHRVTASICDLQGNRIVRESERRDFQSCAEQLSAARRMFLRAASEVPASARIVITAATVSGFFLERGRRLVLKIDPVGWSKVDLRAWMENLTGVPAVIQHDARSIAVHILETPPYRNFINFFLDGGIGGGLVEDGRLILGKNGNAGAVGRLFPRDVTRPTETSLRQTLGITGWGDWEGLDALESDQRATVESWIANAAERFGVAMSYALPLLDFEVVYISSRIPNEILLLLARRIRFEPLGANLVSQTQTAGDCTPPDPIILTHPIQNMSDMTHVSAVYAFLNPSTADATDSLEHIAAYKP